MPQFKIVIGIVLLVILVSGNGCSVIGFTRGAIVDASKPDTVTVGVWDIPTVNDGTTIRVTTVDGEQIMGRFTGLDRAPDENYAVRYSDFRDQVSDTIALPALGDTITTILTTGMYVEGELLGFDFQSVLPGLTGKGTIRSPTQSWIISVRAIGDTASSDLPLRDVRQIAASTGDIFEGEVLRRLAAGKQLPLFSALAVDDSGGIRLVPMDMVDTIELKNKKNEKWTCLAIGAIWDVGAMILFLIMPD